MTGVDRGGPAVRAPRVLSAGPAGAAWLVGRVTVPQR